MTPLADVVGVTCPSALHGAARVAVNAICVEAARCNARRQGFVYALDEWCAFPSITPSCEPSGLETSATYRRKNVSLADHIALHLWGAPAPAGCQPGGAFVAASWPSAWRASHRESWLAR